MKALVNFLKQSDIFHQLTPAQLELAANLCEQGLYQAGILFSKRAITVQPGGRFGNEDPRFREQLSLSGPAKSKCLENELLTIIKS